MTTFMSLILLAALICFAVFLVRKFKNFGGIAYVVTGCISFVVGILIYKAYTYKIYWGEYRVSETFFVNMMVVLGIVLMVAAVALGGIGIVLLSAKYSRKELNPAKVYSGNIKIRCTSCGELNSEEASFCSKCGAKLK